MEGGLAQHQMGFSECNLPFVSSGMTPPCDVMLLKRHQVHCQPTRVRGQRFFFFFPAQFAFPVSLPLRSRLQTTHSFERAAACRCVLSGADGRASVGEGACGAGHVMDRAEVVCPSLDLALRSLCHVHATLLTRAVTVPPTQSAIAAPNPQVTVLFSNQLVNPVLPQSGEDVRESLCTGASCDQHARSRDAPVFDQAVS